MTNTMNDFLFGSNGTSITPLLPILITTKQQAFRAAAWLQVMGVVLPDEPGEPTEFRDILEAVENT